MAKAKNEAQGSTEAPEMQIEYWDIDRLIPYSRNPRRNDDAVPKMAGLIKEFGFKVPVVIRSDGEVIDGHLRLKAARQLGMEKVPVVLADEWTPAQVKAFRLAVNRSAEWAEWDDELLKLELDDLKLEDFDLDLIGFEDVALDDGGAEGLTDPDEVPQLDEKTTISKNGDIWLLGRHRLMCGDSTDAGSVALLMAGEKADLLLTDPPYGVNIVKGGAAAIGGAKPFGSKKGVVSGEKPRELKFGAARDKNDKAIIGATVYHAIIGDESTETAQKSYTIAKENSEVQVIFGGNYFTDFLPPSRCWYVWDKGQPDGTPFAQVELAWVSKDGNARIFHRLWSGLCREGDRKTEGLKRIHPTQKPVSLCCDIIQEVECESVLDLFGGSGSTLIACEQLDKKCYCMEMADYYVDVIIRRWQDFTGKEATLDGDGRTFAQIAEERG